MIAGGIFCALAGIAVMIFSEWSTAPFLKDESFGYFVANLTQLKPVTLGFMIFGGLAAFWFGKGR